MPRAHAAFCLSLQTAVRLQYPVMRLVEEQAGLQACQQLRQPPPPPEQQLPPLLAAPRPGSGLRRWAAGEGVGAVGLQPAAAMEAAAEAASAPEDEMAVEEEVEQHERADEQRTPLSYGEFVTEMTGALLGGAAGLPGDPSQQLQGEALLQLCDSLFLLPPGAVGNSLLGGGGGGAAGSSWGAAGMARLRRALEQRPPLLQRGPLDADLPGTVGPAAEGDLAAAAAAAAGGGGDLVGTADEPQQPRRQQRQQAADADLEAEEELEGIGSPLLFMSQAGDNMDQAAAAGGDPEQQQMGGGGGGDASLALPFPGTEASQPDPLQQQEAAIAVEVRREVLEEQERRRQRREQQQQRQRAEEEEAQRLRQAQEQADAAAQGQIHGGSAGLEQATRYRG